jgi:hypothetical protein
MIHQFWRLSEAGPDNLGLACTDGGLLLGRTPLIERREGRFVVRERAEIEKLLKRAFPVSAAIERLMPGLETVASALNANDPCLARIAAVHLKIPDIPNLSARDEMETEDAVIKSAIELLDSPSRSIAEILRLSRTTKAYHPAEPRVPAGSGAISGEWTRGLSIVEDLSESAAAFLGRFALGVLGPEAGSAAIALGLLLIPSPNNNRVEGEVSGVPGLTYTWNRDESELHFTYDNGGAALRTFTAHLEDDRFVDGHGLVVGRTLSDGIVVIDPTAVSSDLVDEDEPKLCPAPGPDKPGGSERGRDYEDYVKRVVNPDNPTPRGWGYQLPNPQQGGTLVYYDDCQHATGMMVDAKGDYGGVLAFPQGEDSIAEDWVDQSGAQIAASGGRRVRWYFAELASANFARELFKNAGEGRERIEIVVLPWPGSGQ